MARLIDADALLKQFPLPEDMRDPKQALKHITGIRAEIECAPTIEPKTGEWTPIHKGERGFSAGDFRCSICHQPNKCYTMTNYCSHCGADMRSDK